nr:hypothetical protein [Methylocapsa aurea]
MSRIVFGLARGRRGSRPACLRARSEFRHFDEQGEGGDFRDAGDGEKNLKAPSELSVVVDKFSDGGVDLVDFHIDLGEALFVLPFEQGQRDRFGAIFVGRVVFDERGAGKMKFFQLGDGLTDAGTRPQIENLAHAREHGGVGAICFHELAGGFSETAGLTRIDLGDGNAGRIQRALEHAMIRADGFEDDARHWRCGEPFDQGLAAGFFALEPDDFGRNRNAISSKV